MPKEVDECVKSILKKNPDMNESTAWAICQKLYKQGKLNKKSTSSMIEEAKRLWREKE